MKHATFLLSLAPGAAFAHGGHATLPPGAHEASHAAPAIACILIVSVAVVAVIQRMRS